MEMTRGRALLYVDRETRWTGERTLDLTTCSPRLHNLGEWSSAFLPASVSREALLDPSYHGAFGVNLTPVGHESSRSAEKRFIAERVD